MNTRLTLSYAALFVVFALLVISLGSQSTSASVAYSNDYTATSTAANSLYGATVTSGRVIKSGAGSLAQVTITGANTGIVNLYNATTTNVNLRTGNKATSTILLASFPASAAAGTYTFDAQFSDGLYIDLASGNMPTSTITYR